MWAPNGSSPASPSSGGGPGGTTSDNPVLPMPSPNQPGLKQNFSPTKTIAFAPGSNTPAIPASPVTTGHQAGFAQQPNAINQRIGLKITSSESRAENFTDMVERVSINSKDWKVSTTNEDDSDMSPANRKLAKFLRQLLGW